MLINAYATDRDPPGLELPHRLRARRDRSPSAVEPGVIAQRHHALDWLTRFEDADWDDVTTPT